MLCRNEGSPYEGIETQNNVFAHAFQCLVEMKETLLVAEICRRIYMQVSQEHLRTPNIMPRQGHGGTKVSVWTND